MPVRRIFVALALALTVGSLCTEPALASGGRYTVVGGTARHTAEVRKALNVSRFDWSIVPQQITIHVVPGKEASSTPGHIWLSPELLSSGTFAWAIVQHEYGHQVDFFLLNDAKREFLTERLHAAGWCHEVAGLRHDRYGCERFSSTLAWAYWPDERNSLRPRTAKDESAAMKPAPFRALLTKLIGVADPFAPTLQSRPR